MATQDESKDDTMTTRQAGERGGRETAKKGPEFYSEIGKMQDSDKNPGNFKNRPHDKVEEAAKRGGEARGQQMHEEAEARHRDEDLGEAA